MRIETGSSLQTFMTCPKLYKYKYIDKLSSPMYSSALAYGTFVHAFVERYNGDRPNEPGRAFERELKEYGEQNEQRIRLDFEARDSHELVARGKHVRAVIDLERFRKRLKKKTGA